MLKMGTMGCCICYCRPCFFFKKMKPLNIIIFLIIVLSIYFFLNYYVYKKIANGLNLSGNSISIIRIIFIICALSFPLAEFSKRLFPSYAISFTGGTWLGLVVLGFTVFIIKDLLLLFIPADQKTSTIIGLIIIFILALSSIYNASLDVKVKEVKLKIQKWPAKMKGFTLVQISDLHICALTKPADIKAIFDKINQINPDLIVITGDLADEDISQSRLYSSMLKGLKAKYGTYATAGNHEFFTGIEGFKRLFKKAGIKFLRNKKITIAQSIDLIGVDDITAERFGGTKPDIEKLIKQCDGEKPIILLNHMPIWFKKAAELGVDLQLSGHTHNGQMPPLHPLVYIFFKYSYGLSKYRSSYIYTTSGTGIWAIPMRLFSRSEIVKFVFE